MRLAPIEHRLARVEGPPLSLPDPIRSMNLAARIAREVGDLISNGRRDGVGHVVTKSSPTDLVTEWDTRAEELIRSRLSQWRPNDGILGEEGETIHGDTGIDWVVDPIDGTTNFAFGLSGYAVSIAAVDAVGAVAAAVYAPEVRELFVAARGYGAWLRGKALHCSQQTSISLALIGTGFAYDPAVRREQWDVLVDRAMDLRDIRRIGAASLDLCYVACGRLDAYFERNLQPWDMAAGALIAQEAGAKVTDFAGNPASRGDVLASGPLLHADLVALLLRPGIMGDHDRALHIGQDGGR